MERTNNKSVVALILGILSIAIPLIGFVFGIIGLVYANISMKEIAATNENGRGIALAGRICSIVGLCFAVIYILLAVIGIVSYYQTDVKI